LNQVLPDFLLRTIGREQLSIIKFSVGKDKYPALIDLMAVELLKHAEKRGTAHLQEHFSTLRKLAKEDPELAQAMLIILKDVKLVPLNPERVLTDETTKAVRLFMGKVWAKTSDAVLSEERKREIEAEIQNQMSGGGVRG
jgi:hypothetical protein